MAKKRSAKKRMAKPAARAKRIVKKPAPKKRVQSIPPGITRSRPTSPAAARRRRLSSTSAPSVRGRGRVCRVRMGRLSTRRSRSAIPWSCSATNRPCLGRSRGDARGHAVRVVHLHEGRRQGVCDGRYGRSDRQDAPDRQVLGRSVLHDDGSVRAPVVDGHAYRRYVVGGDAQARSSGNGADGRRTVAGSIVARKPGQAQTPRRQGAQIVVGDSERRPASRRAAHPAPRDRRNAAKLTARVNCGRPEAVLLAGRWVRRLRPG